MTALKALEDRVYKDSRVVKVTSPYTVFEEIYPKLYNAPPDPSHATDLETEDTFVFASTGGSSELSDYLSTDITIFRAQIFLVSLSNTQVRGFVDDVLEPALTQSFGENSQYETAVSGIPVLWENMDRSIMIGQLQSIAILVISIICIFYFVFRDARVVTVAVVANLFPVILIAAGFGYAEVNIDVATVFILSLILGISIDDTSFFLHRYISNRNTKGMAKREAILDSVYTKCIPITLTTIVIIAGFSVLLLSGFLPIVTFGLLVSLGLLIAVVLDILGMPILLHYLHK